MWDQDLRTYTNQNLHIHPILKKNNMFLVNISKTLKLWNPTTKSKRENTASYDAGKY